MGVWWFMEEEILYRKPFILRVFYMGEGLALDKSVLIVYACSVIDI